MNQIGYRTPLTKLRFPFGSTSSDNNDNDDDDVMTMMYGADGFSMIQFKHLSLHRRGEGVRPEKFGTLGEYQHHPYTNFIIV